MSIMTHPLFWNNVIPASSFAVLGLKFTSVSAVNVACCWRRKMAAIDSFCETSAGTALMLMPSVPSE
jgi:hypothetical protein